VANRFGRSEILLLMDNHLHNSILLSHSGKQHSYHVAKAMQQLGVLKEFHTSSYVTNKWLQNLSNRRRFEFLRRRFEEGLSSPIVHSNWRFEIPEIIIRSLIGNSQRINELVYRRDYLFDSFIARKLEKAGINTFWGFQGSCLQSLKMARFLGITGVCEMTLSHVPFANNLLWDEKQLNPEWADSIDFTLFPGWYEKRMIEEPFEASHVVAISAFLKRTLLCDGIPEKKVSVIPLGFDISQMAFTPKIDPIENRPLKFLFAGKVTQRKGVSYMLEAFERFSKMDVELHIIGNVFGSGKAFQRYKHVYEHKTAISQAQLFKEYRNYDVLVFPSLLEGFGLVNIEAMGAGLPVITTPNTNAAEVLHDGINGFLVPIRDAEAIAKSVERIRNMDTETFSKMRLMARKTAEMYTWNNYMNSLNEFLSPALK
jgi:starch synthase